MGLPRAEADIDPATGLFRCGSCGGEVAVDAEWCRACRSRFVGPSNPVSATLQSPILRLYRSLYRRISWTSDAVSARLQALAKGGPMSQRVKVWDDSDPATLVLKCDGAAKEVGEWLAAALPKYRSQDPALSAVRSMEADGGSVKVSLQPLARDPNSLVLKIASRVPLLRRYERVMYEVALDRAVEMLRQVRIADPEKVAESYPFELSGGMAQRVMIAIALSCSPQLLIADEPTTAVDVTIQAQVLKLMRDLKERVQASVLLITHNLGVVAEMCDRVGVMYAGTMAEIGPTRAVFKEPLHPYTKGLMESIPRVTEEKERLQIIPGTVPNLITPPLGCRFHPRCPVALAHCGWTAKEVRSRLEPLVEERGRESIADAVLGWDDKDPAKLIVRCERPQDVADWCSSTIALHKEDAVLQTVESVAVEDSRVVLRLIRQVKPPMLEPSPGHFVSCYQYGGWPPA
ncbi:MAG: ABC transporter ATP-binding protein [Candidatus Thermoplasmatota archaeon]